VKREPLLRIREKRQTDRSRTRRTQEASPPAATLHGKIQGFVLRLPPQNKIHATFMQPLQRVTQHHVANLHVSTHMTTKRDNIHAAIPLRFATSPNKAHATFMQP